jgi:hypothetical protein
MMGTGAADMFTEAVASVGAGCGGIGRAPAAAGLRRRVHVVTVNVLVITVRCEVGLVVGRARLWGVGEEQGVPQYLRHQQQRIVGALGLL